MGRRRKESEPIFIDLTLSDDSENELTKNFNEDNKSESSVSSISSVSSVNDCPFEPPLNIKGNILNRLHYKILKSSSAWFNDDIINGFFCKLSDAHRDRVFAFSSFFYTSLLERGKEFCMKHSMPKDFKAFLNSSTQTNQTDKIVLIPVNSAATHWVLVVWYLDSGTIKYFDSLMCRRSGKRIMKRISEFFNEYLTLDDLETALENLNVTDTDKEFSSGKMIKSLEIPKGQIQQTDGSSCGPFCCFFAKNLTSESEKDFVDIYEFRESLIEFFLDK